MSSTVMKKAKSIPAIKKLADLSSRLATNTRICIVGAGPSGLSAAYALANLGYQNVTVLEKKNQVGGMCESIEIEGRMYDVGGQVLTLDRTPNIRELINQLNVEMEDMSNHRLALIDCSNGSCEDLKVAKDSLSLMPHTLQLQEEAEESGKLGVHALSNLASETTRDYLSRKGIHKELPEAVAASYTASGYGFLDDMPYAYVHEFGRTCMLGKVSRVKGGYAGFWQKVAASYVPNLKCNIEVINIDRTGGVVKVLARNDNTDVKETLEFDYIFLTGALPFCTLKDGTYRSPSLPQRNSHQQLLDFTPTEKVLFSKVRTIDYYTTILKITQLSLEVGFYFCKYYVEDPQKIGHPVAIQRFFPDTDIYVAWSYGNSNVDQQQITKLLFEDIESIGGQVGDVILQQKWDYFPHVSSKEMTTNFYDKLEALQGQNNTCYLGALFAFELTERNVAYSMDIVGHFFGAEKKPSLKSLMGTPLETNKVQKANFLDELTELPGVQFPDLPHVDAYLTYYSHHDTFKNRVLYTWLDEQGKQVDRRTFAEVDERAMIIADQLATKYNLGPNDCVLLLYPPGLDFIEAFMGCLRAKVLAVPLMPPEPGQAGQALMKLQNVSEKCHPKLIISTVSYHSAVYLASIKSRILPGYAFRANTANATWPQLPWLHTDSLSAKGQSSYFERIVEYFCGHASTLYLQNSSHASLALQEGKGDTCVENAVVKESDKKSKHKTSESYIQRGRTFIKPTDVSFLQFTSGSTGDAKGVIITHGGLIHNVKLMRSKFKSTSRTVLVSWLPQFHDMGLIGGLLTSMVSGGTAVLFSPVTFIKNPMLWLETMSRYKATHSAAPNFAFELIVRRLEMLQASGINTSYIDLKSIQFLMSSAEPIRHKSLHRFLELLKCTGLREQNIAPGYGLAENCVFVSCAYGKGQPIILDWENRVCCGYIERGNRDADVRIVNPETFEEMPDGIEGEVWVSSLSTGAGYWGEIELGKTAFQNRIKISTPPVSAHGTFLRTGDLGRVMQGLLFITGRIKDLIILHGRNIYPTDVEKTVETCSHDLRPGCCAAVCAPAKLLQQRGAPIEELEDEASLVIIAEVRDRRKGDYEALALQIKSAIASEHGIEDVTICLIKHRTIPKTSSGKIRRLECFHHFVNNNLQLVYPIKASQSLQTYNMRKSFDLKRDKIVQEDFVNENQKTCTLPTLSLSKDFISKFLIEIMSEKTGIPTDQISVDKKIDSYGIDSIGVAWIAHRLSVFLGLHVAAIDIYSASCISELIDFVDRLPKEKNLSFISVAESHGEIEHSKTQICSEQAAGTPKKPPLGLPCDTLIDSDFKSAASEPTLARRVGITALQVISILFMTFLLTSPAIFLSYRLTWLLSKTQSKYFIVLTVGLVPATFILYIVLVGLTLSLLGMTIHLPRYSLRTWIPFWSIDYVRWWTMYRVQDFASNMLAIHLRGTIFLTWWYRALGAYIGHGVNLDTTDITDPSLLMILEGASIGEGVTLQSHEVNDSGVWLEPIKIGKMAHLEPFSFISKGTSLENGITVAALGKGPTSKAQHVVTKAVQKQDTEKTISTVLPLIHLFGLYIIGLASTIAATVVAAYFRWCIINLGIIPKDPEILRAYHESKAEYVLFPLAAVFPWALAGVFPLACCQDPGILFHFLKGVLAEGKVIPFVGCIGGAYFLFGIGLWAITCTMKRILLGKVEAMNDIKPTSSLGFRMWLVQRLITFLHFKFTMFLAGTYMMCTYLRSMGATIGHAASIRRISPITDPDMLDIGERCHLGDHANVITRGNCLGSSSTCLGKVKVGRECVVGAHSVLMPKSTLEDGAWLAALSVAPSNSVLEKGGIYMGVESLVKIRNQSLEKNSILARFPYLEKDIGIAEMNPSYLQAISQLVDYFAATSISLRKRSLHQTGIGAKGTMKILEDLHGLPNHDIFFPGRTFPIIIRHSNAFSIHDDACPDVRGAGLRILESEGEGTLLDLILKTGPAFYVRNLADQINWLQKDEKGQEEIVKKFPHIGKAIWDARRVTDSYTKVHYYSNVCRHLRPSLSSKEEALEHPTDTREFYVKFRLRPEDSTYGENYGEVQPEKFPPTNGSLSRRLGDIRPPTCLADDFKERVLASGGIHYVLQMQIQPIPDIFSERESVLDCTKPWDGEDFPFRDLASIHLNELLPNEVTEALRLNHKNSTRSLDLVLAKSATDSASIDHARSLTYGIVQYLRSNIEVPSSLQELSKSKSVDRALEFESAGHCPATFATLPPDAAMRTTATSVTNVKGRDLISQSLVSSIKLMSIAKKDPKTIMLNFLLGLQPFLQIMLPVTLLALVNYPSCLSLSYLGLKAGSNWMYILLPCMYLLSGLFFCLATILSKWMLVGRAKETSITSLRDMKIFQETTWCAINTLLASYFLEFTRGSSICPFYFRSLGASIGKNVYMDTLFVLNPDLLKLREGSAIGRNALLFGHLYEGRHVIFKGNEIGARACIGARALVLPGLKMEDGSQLTSLSLGMKDEVITR